ncbi:MAG: hypothetical protein GY938_27790 [Ketobacter sp.]|nr:hypothetical protein [Ketobacter sp.]
MWIAEVRRGRLKNIICLVMGTLTAALLSVAGYADDTDLFDASGVSEPARIMLVVDTSGSMGNTETENFMLRDNNSVLDDSYGGNCEGTQTFLVRRGEYVTINNADRKICIVRRVLLQFLDPSEGGDSIWPDHFMVGMAVYAEPGANIIRPMAALGSINDPLSNRNQLISSIDGLVVSGFTPLVGSYLEVAEYLTGGHAVTRDTTDTDSSVWEDANRYLYAGVDLGAQCRDTNNHLIFLTDGESYCEKASGLTEGEKEDKKCTDQASFLQLGTLGTRVNEFVTGTEGGYHESCPANSYSHYLTVEEDERANYSSYWGCLSIAADRLRTNTQPDGSAAGVTTHVIAYDLANGEGENAASEAALTAGLQAWAQSGGGRYVAASNSAELEQAFQAINSETILPGTFVMASGSVGISQLNRFAHLDEMYFSVFTPSTKPFWYGNLKKYYFQLDAEGDLGIYTNSNKTIPAVNEGAFLDDVTSEWTGTLESAFYNTTQPRTLDGDIAHIGGAASKIEQPDDRRLFAYYGGVPYLITSDDADTPGEAIDNLSGLMSTHYGTFLDDAAGADAPAVAAYNANVLLPSLSWLRGVDVNDEWIRISQHPNAALRPADPEDARGADTRDLRNFYGAPLHSSPVLVNYRSRDASGVALDDTDDVVFISTNDGKLYAVDSDSGEEHLAYMPEAMLRRPALDVGSPVERMYNATKEDAADGGLIYGLDSTWTVWRQDVDRNGNIDEDTLDFVYLYGGMRRGGRNYYILDATDVQGSETISEVAVVQGGVGEFLNNGQSWSEPRLAIIKYNATPAAVFIVGGGYDTAYDNGRPDQLPAKGAQLYIIAAREFTDAGGVIHPAGEVLWWASSELTGTGNHVQISSLQYSIPSTVKIIDRDGNGFLDHIYVGDMGGQILRFDINNSNTGAANLVSNTTDAVVAQLGVSAFLSAPTNMENDRRFFHTPSVAQMRCPAGSCMAIAIGSGWRSNPTDATVNEKFYFLMDYEPFTGNKPIINEAATVGDGASTAVQPISKIAVDGSVTASSPITGVVGYSLPLGGTNYAAEKLLGSPLIAGGAVYFSTYYRPPVEPGEEVCEVTGAAAIYSFRPGDAQAVILESGLSQNVAGSLQALISEIPPSDGGDGGDDEPPPGGGDQPPAGIMSGTGSVGPAPLRLDVIRKTRWMQLD